MSEDKDVLELKRMRTKGLIVGGGLIALGLVSLFGILIFINPPVAYGVYVFIICTGITLFGGFYLIYVGDAAKHLLHGVEIIKKVEPDELVITKNFVLGRKGNIYLLTKRTAYMLVLLKFNELVETNTKKIKVRLPLTKFAKSRKIAGKKVYYSRGKCTIPISRDKYATGDAVIYSIDMETLVPIIAPLYPVSRMHKFEKESLLEIINTLENEVI